MVFQSIIPKLKQTFTRSNFERITQPVTDFVRGNPILSGVVLGSGGTLLTLASASVVKRVTTRKKKKKKAPTRRKRKAAAPRRKRTKKRTAKQIRAMRLRNLKKARAARRTGKRRRIIRGRGLGTHEIKHSGRSTKGKMRVVQFRNKKTGKMVRFKVRR